MNESKQFLQDLAELFKKHHIDRIEFNEKESYDDEPYLIVVNNGGNHLVSLNLRDNVWDTTAYDLDLGVIELELKSL